MARHPVDAAEMTGPADEDPMISDELFDAALGESGPQEGSGDGVASRGVGTTPPADATGLGPGRAEGVVRPVPDSDGAGPASP